jgi:RNA polymerase sigma factor (sigma-70 family)
MSIENQLDEDATLMVRVRSGDLDAFEFLVQKYRKQIINTAYRYTGNSLVAEDLAQDVFVRVFRAASDYQPEARFSTWLFTILRNVCSNYRTRQGRLDRFIDQAADPDQGLGKNESAEQRMIRKETENKIQDAIRALPESLKMPFVLNQFAQLRYAEVAEILNLTLSAVKLRIHRARLLLADQLIELKPMD